MNFRLTLILILISSTLFAQKIIGKAYIEKPAQMVWVKLTNGTKAKGVLFKANSDNIHLALKRNLLDTIETYDVLQINVSDIYSIKSRKRNRVGRGAAIGGGVGFLTGAALMASEGAPGWMLGIGIMTGALGSAIGTLTSLPKKTFKIKGDLEQYHVHLEDIQTRVYRKRLN